MWHCYREALSAQERRGVPCVGISVDRRAMEEASVWYSDARIRSLICFVCAQRQICTTSQGCCDRLRQELQSRSDMCADHKERARFHRRMGFSTDPRDDPRDDCEHSARSPITYILARDLLALEEEVQQANLDFNEFERKY